MDKERILKVISDALDQLAQKPEHVIAEQDIRSILNDDIITEIHLKDGKVVFFQFLDTPQYREDTANRARAMKMFEEPDWGSMRKNISRG